MKRITYLLFFTTLLQASGQKHFIGLRGGLNLSNSVPGYSLVHNEKRVAVTAGIHYDYLILRWLSIGAGLAYSPRGHSEQDYTWIGNQWYGFAGGHDIRVNYLSFPIVTGVNFGKKIYGFANVGVVPSLLLDAHVTYENYLSGASETWGIKSGIEKSDVAWLAEAGAGYKLKEIYWIFGSLAFQRSTQGYLKEELREYGNMRHRILTLSVGIKYLIKKAEATE